MDTINQESEAILSSLKKKPYISNSASFTWVQGS